MRPSQLGHKWPFDKAQGIVDHFSSTYPRESDVRRPLANDRYNQPMQAQLRIARPVSDISRSESMYCAALNLVVLARFQDHQGFDGVMLGRSGMDYHFEFTQCRERPVTACPTHEDLLVFYIPDREEWESACDRLVDNGFVRVTSFNPYWDVSGRTFADPDGYRVVMQNAAWSS